MSEHTATIRWSRGDRPFDAGYPREHAWSFDSGQTLRASAAPGYGGATDAVDPEEALVAALSGCHMLTFLAIAAKKQLVVDRYEDDAAGTLDKNADGRLAITRVVLRPRVVFGGDAPDAGALARLHESAHRNCFIANSVRCEVVVEPQAD